jgi:Domain of unknown function (DUF6456)
MSGKMGKAARPPETAAAEIGDFRGRHLALAERRLSTEFGRANVTVNDICCFLKGLEDIERERAWPPRTGKIVLQLALERIARHYGFAVQAHGRAKAPLRIWLADDAGFGVEGG